MAHSHAHAHGDGEGTYFLDQMFTILACGALGAVAISMYLTGMLERILVPMFYPMVLAGGVAILATSVIRGVAVWQLAGARRAAEAQADADLRNGHGHSHDHGHSHADSHGGEACGHDHGHGATREHDHGHSHAHDHDAHSLAGPDAEGHDHSWAPWRYIVIAIPVFLYLVGLPRAGYTSGEVNRNLSGALQAGSVRKSVALLASGLAYPKTQPRRLELRFKELSEAAALPVRHEIYEGDIGVIRGQFNRRPDSDHEFSLFRVNRTCCAADEVFLEIRILAPDASAIGNIQPYQWVRVEGVISFQQSERGKWIPVLTMQSADAIDPNAPATNDVNSY